MFVQNIHAIDTDVDRTASSIFVLEGNLLMNKQNGFYLPAASLSSSSSSRSLSLHVYAKLYMYAFVCLAHTCLGDGACTQHPPGRQLQFYFDYVVQTLQVFSAHILFEMVVW